MGMIRRLFAAVLSAAWLISAPAIAQTKISASQTIGAPGVYEVTVAGVTVTLPAWTGWASPQPIIIKDATLNSAPNITVASPLGGTIDGGASVVINNPNQGLIFEPFQGGNLWVVGGSVSGVSAGSAAAAGTIGEVISSDIPSASAVAQATSGTAVNVTSVSLTPGDWDCTGSVVTKPAGTTTTSGLAGGISTVTGALPVAVEVGSTIFQAPQAAAIAAAIPIARVQELLTTTTPIYLVGNSVFAVSTMSLYGQIICRRMR
jgi:hypothetical protein